LFLKPETIGIIPHGGYNRKERQSLIAIKWLKYISKTENIRIRHTLNGGEVRIGPYRVDGIHQESGRIFEFQGCYWHGCPKCVPNRQEPMIDKMKTAEEAFQATVQRWMYLEQQGFSVIEKWECQLRIDLKVMVNLVHSLHTYKN